MVVRLQTALGELVQFQEVLKNLFVQDFKVRYQRTYFGYIWSLFNPLFHLLVLSVIFSHVVRLKMGNYTQFLFSGILAWSFFNTSVALASKSFLENENFIKKVYLPKLMFPLTKVLIRTVDFVFALLSLLAIGLVLGFEFPTTLIWLPAAFAHLFVFTLGVSLIMSVVTVFFRDAEFILGVMIQLFWFGTPIFYPIASLPESYQKWMAFNPVYTQIRVFHELIYFGTIPSVEVWAGAWGMAFLSLGVGLWVLFRYEDELVYRM